MPKRARNIGQLARRFRGRTAAIVPAVIVAGVMVAAGPHSSAATAPGTGTWPAGVAHPARVSCPRGELPVTPTGGWRDVKGVSHLTYKSMPGMVTTLPPRGVKAATVTPALLADLGLHAGSRTRAALRQSMDRQVAAESAHLVAPSFCRLRHPLAAPAQLAAKSRKGSGPGIVGSHVFTGNWGGTGITSAENGTGINGVAGSFTVGTDKTTSGPGAESTWLGLGGGLDSEGPPLGLIQDGVIMSAGKGYQSWLETVNYNSSGNYTCCALKAIGTARPGDSITSEVWWNSASQACFFLYDQQHSGGDIPSTCLTTSSGPNETTYDHTSAEWVNESSFSEGFNFYDNPGTIKWTGQLFDNNFGLAGSMSSPFPAGESIIMYYTASPPSGTSCATPGVLSYPDNIGTNSAGGFSSIETCVITGVDSP
jgi:hypothetical protein